jgi:phosphoserine phosphatase
MKLILQGPGATSYTIERIAALAHATHITAIADSAFRCDGVVDTPSVREAVENSCIEEHIDHSFISKDYSLDDFRVLVMDMDSTLITIECIDEIADLHGLKSEVAEITESAMRGELDFRASLTRRVALLKGLDASALHQVFDQRLRLSPGARELLIAVKAAGIRTVLVSGGFTYFTDRLQHELAIDYTRANVLDIVDGKLTGKVIGDIIDATIKRQTVEHECAAVNVPTSNAIVIGDGANDLEMMSVAGLSVAYRAKPIVQQQADVALNFSGLDGVLNLFR